MIRVLLSQRPFVSAIFPQIHIVTSKRASFSCYIYIECCLFCVIKHALRPCIPLSTLKEKPAWIELHTKGRESDICGQIIRTSFCHKNNYHLNRHFFHHLAGANEISFYTAFRFTMASSAANILQKQFKGNDLC